MMGARASHISMNYTGFALSDVGPLRALTHMGFEVCLLSCGEVVLCRDYNMGSCTLVSRAAAGSVPRMGCGVCLLSCGEVARRRGGVRARAGRRYCARAVRVRVRAAHLWPAAHAGASPSSAPSLLSVPGRYLCYTKTHPLPDGKRSIVIHTDETSGH